MTDPVKSGNKTIEAKDKEKAIDQRVNLQFDGLLNVFQQND